MTAKTTPLQAGSYLLFETNAREMKPFNGALFVFAGDHVSEADPLAVAVLRLIRVHGFFR
jgi:hypothetical protein